MDASIAARLGGIKNTMSETMAENPPMVVDAIVSAPVTVAEQPAPSAIGNMRIFRSNPPGTRFQFSNGVEIYFNHGWYETDNPQEIKELEAVVASGKGCIYTDARQDQILEAVNKARSLLGTKATSAEMADVLNQAVVIGEHPEVGNAIPGTMPILSPADQAGIDPIQSLQAAIRNAGAKVAGSTD